MGAYLVTLDIDETISNTHLATWNINGAASGDYCLAAGSGPIIATPLPGDISLSGGPSTGPEFYFKDRASFVVMDMGNPYSGRFATTIWALFLEVERPV